MKLNILQSDVACKSCVKSYAKKHNFQKGDTFDISCRGIPQEYVSSATAALLDSEINPELVMDPVKWASEVLDWHCLDPDGSVWARKNPDEYLRQMADSPNRQSKYHRPYQAEMLRCSSKYKIFRIGRQAGKTETLVVSMLFNMFTNAGFKIVLITPYQSQVEVIFKRLEDLINSNPTLQNSIKRNVKAPNYTLILHNGSQIKGFTAGTKSGNGAASVRGQDANMLVFDEADYLDRSDMDAAMAIVTNYPEATVWMSSTPTGRREKFYETCLDREWKEFHFPSHVNPNWSESLDRLFRKNLTAIGYKHEILADFGEQEEGVFQAPYVEAAIADYKMSSCKPTLNWLYSIGVDWNSPKIGTTIYVTGFNISTNKFMVVESAIVQRAGWTQTAAIQKIIELNRKWRPFAIYVDQGYGSTQIEILRKFGFDARVDPSRGPKHLDSQIVKVLRAYDFGSSIEIKDPFTKEPKKKPAKGFLVENAVRRFENNEILISSEDQQLKRELLGYIVKNVTVTGQVVYTTLDDAIGDHNLDALMLSLVAFTLEKSDLGNPTYSNKIMFTPIEHNSLPEEGKTDKKTLQSSLAPEDRSTLKGKDPKMPTKLWAHPGFLRDEPVPKMQGSKNNGIFLRRSGVPNRRSSF